MNLDKTSPSASLSPADRPALNMKKISYVSRNALLAIAALGLVSCHKDVEVREREVEMREKIVEAREKDVEARERKLEAKERISQVLQMYDPARTEELHTHYAAPSPRTASLRPEQKKVITHTPDGLKVINGETCGNGIDDDMDGTVDDLECNECYFQGEAVSVGTATVCHSDSGATGTQVCLPSKDGTLQWSACSSK